MRTSSYKGFRILARPYQINACKRWTVDLEIRRGGRCQVFSPSGLYRTEHEAAAHCYCLAHRIIDGADPRWSVDYLRGARRNRRRLTPTWMEGSLRQLLVAGIVLLVVGTLLLARGTSTAQGAVVPDRGAAEAITQPRATIPRPVGGVAAVAAGVVLLVAGVRKRT
jgi:hypothetical protein